MGAVSRKWYDREFKLEAVRMADKPDAVDRRVDQDLGLYQGAIRHWRQELEADPKHAFVGTGHLKPLEEENRRLLLLFRIWRKNIAKPLPYMAPCMEKPPNCIWKTSLDQFAQGDALGEEELPNSYRGSPTPVETSPGPKAAACALAQS
jgi:transposase